MDYLPIQASSVPCERVFSSAGETDTKKRNRISPILMEALQMLKYSYRKERLNFTSGWAITTHELKEPSPSKDLLAQLFKDDEDQADATDQLLHVLAVDDTDDGDDEGDA